MSSRKARLSSPLNFRYGNWVREIERVVVGSRDDEVETEVGEERGLPANARTAGPGTTLDRAPSSSGFISDSLTGAQSRRVSAANRFEGGSGAALVRPHRPQPPPHHPALSARHEQARGAKGLGGFKPWPAMPEGLTACFVTSQVLERVFT